MKGYEEEGKEASGRDIMMVLPPSLSADTQNQVRRLGFPGYSPELDGALQKARVASVEPVLPAALDLNRPTDKWALEDAEQAREAKQQATQTRGAARNSVISPRGALSAAPVGLTSAQRHAVVAALFLLTVANVICNTVLVALSTQLGIFHDQLSLVFGDAPELSLLIGGVFGLGASVVLFTGMPMLTLAIGGGVGTFAKVVVLIADLAFSLGLARLQAAERSEPEAVYSLAVVEFALLLAFTVALFVADRALVRHRAANEKRRALAAEVEMAELALDVATTEYDEALKNEKSTVEAQRLREDAGRYREAVKTFVEASTHVEVVTTAAEMVAEVSREPGRPALGAAVAPVASFKQSFAHSSQN